MILLGTENYDLLGTFSESMKGALWGTKYGCHAQQLYQVQSNDSPLEKVDYHSIKMIFIFLVIVRRPWKVKMNLI